jgi:hypothetical protein
LKETIPFGIEGVSERRRFSNLATNVAWTQINQLRVLERREEESKNG